MRGGNVCKFVPMVNENELKIKNFVFESNHTSMAKEVKQNYNRIILIADGEGSFIVDGTEHIIKTGDILFIFNGEKIFAKPKNDEFKYIYITFYGIRAEELMLRFGINGQKRHFSDCDGLIPTWREALSLATDSNIDLVAEGMLLYAFSRFGRRDGASDDLIYRITALSEEGFTDPDMSLSAIAKSLNYNPKYLSHVFKERMGMAYTEYLRMLRMKYAISLFEHGLDSIKNVAILSGFTDPLYFSTVFKKTVGMSPKDYISRKLEGSEAGGTDAGQGESEQQNTAEDGE